MRTKLAAASKAIAKNQSRKRNIGFMEQATLSRTRGYEELEDDPAYSPSPAPNSAVVADDLAKSIADRVYGHEVDERDLLTTQAFDDSTGQVIAEAAVTAAGPTGRIAFAFCPSLFQLLKEAHPDRQRDHLFDFDPRFKSLGNMTVVPVDHSPKVPAELEHAFHVVVADLSYMHTPEEIKDVLEMATLLMKLHEPLRIVVLAPQNLAPTLEAAGLHSSAGLLPHCKSGANLRVFSKLVDFVHRL